jgi:hypothetical protein
MLRFELLASFLRSQAFSTKFLICFSQGFQRSQLCRSPFRSADCDVGILCLEAGGGERRYCVHARTRVVRAEKVDDTLNKLGCKSQCSLASCDLGFQILSQDSSRLWVWQKVYGRRHHGRGGQALRRHLRRQQRK